MIAAELNFSPMILRSFSRCHKYLLVGLEKDNVFYITIDLNVFFSLSPHPFSPFSGWDHISGWLDSHIPACTLLLNQVSVVFPFEF